MQSWLNFIIILFWLSLCLFYYNPTNFVMLLLYSELCWVIIYTYSIIIGLLCDDLNAITMSFFILGFAGLEYAIGFLLLIKFKETNISLGFVEDAAIWKQYFLKNKEQLYSLFTGTVYNKK